MATEDSDRAASAESFEVQDNPKLLRAWVAGSIAMLGAMVVFMAGWNLWNCACAPTRDSDVYGIWLGAIFLIAGVIYWLMPIPPPRTMLSGARDGLTFPVSFPIEKSTKYLTLPWEQIFALKVIVFGDGYGIEIEVSLSEVHLEKLRLSYGQIYVGSANTIEHCVPVLGYRNRVNEILRNLEAIKAASGIVESPVSTSEPINVLTR